MWAQLDQHIQSMSPDGGRRRYAPPKPDHVIAKALARLRDAGRRRGAAGRIAAAHGMSRQTLLYHRAKGEPVLEPRTYNEIRADLAQQLEAIERRWQASLAAARKKDPLR